MAVESAAPMRFGVAGYPVAHSRSPQMHEAVYAELGLDAEYQRLPIPPELFRETVRALPRSGFVGINVTIPHKHAAAELADEVSPEVEATGAANTLTFENGKIHADNTDAPGLIDAIERPVAGLRTLVIGAGGTGHAAAWALQNAGAEVSVHNRTGSRAAKLADDLHVAVAVDTVGGAGFELIVNATAVGMDPSIDEDAALAALGLDLAKIPAHATIVDFVYREGGSPLTLAARTHGLAVVDGNELLVRQGALSFAIWFGRPAPLQTMRTALTSD